MKILMLLGPSTGGIGTHVADLSAHLRADGVQIATATAAMTAQEFGLLDAARVWPRADASAPRDVARLRRLIRQADVVHAHGFQAGLLAVGVGLGSTPIVTSLHNDLPWRSGVRGHLADLAFTRLARSSALVTGASSDLVDAARIHGARWAELAQVPSPRTAALLAAEPLNSPRRAALASDLLAAHGIQPSGPLVLTMSRVAPQKDLTTVVRAAARLRAATWVIAGGGVPELRADLEAQASRLGAPVHFVGPVERPEDWFRAAEVFVLTSRWEARALVVQEAMAAGIPVVASAVGGLPDLLAGIGTLVAPGDDQAVADAVEHWITDPSARAAAVDAGRDRAKGWDDSTDSARRWRGWYERVLAMA